MYPKIYSMRIYPMYGSIIVTCTCTYEGYMSLCSVDRVLSVVTQSHISSSTNMLVRKQSLKLIQVRRDVGVV